MNYFGIAGELSLGMALFIAAVAGGILVAIAGAARIIQLRSQRRHPPGSPGADAGGHEPPRPCREFTALAVGCRKVIGSNEGGAQTGTGRCSAGPRVGEDRLMDAAGTFLIVVGVDGSEPSLAALRWAVDEARLRHGKVLLITAWHYPPVPSTVEDRGGNDPFTPLSVSRPRH